MFRACRGGWAVLLVLGACGKAADPGESLEAARAALQRGDFPAAAAGLKDVLARADATASQRFQALREQMVCQAHVASDAEVIAVFERLQAEFAERLDLDTLVGLCAKVHAAGRSQAAREVITYTKERHGSDPEAERRLKKLARELEESGDEEMLRALEDMGYLGEEEEEEE